MLENIRNFYENHKEFSVALILVALLAFAVFLFRTFGKGASASAPASTSSGSSTVPLVVPLATGSSTTQTGDTTDGQGGGGPASPTQPILPPNQVNNPKSSQYTTTVAGQTIYQLEAIGQQLAPGYSWGATGIQQRNPALSKYGLSSPLPAGLYIEVA